MEEILEGKGLVTAMGTSSCPLTVHVLVLRHHVKSVIQRGYITLVTYVQNTSFVKQMLSKIVLDGFPTDFSDILLKSQLLLILNFVIVIFRF